MAVKASVTITISKYRDTDSITRYYKLQASTAAAPAVPTTLTPSGWSTSEPTYTSGSTNTLYYTDCIVFSDGTFQYTDDGNGKAVKSSSYEAAKEAYNKAQAAQDSADATQENLDNLEIGGRNFIVNSANGVGYARSDTGGIIIDNDNSSITVTSAGGEKSEVNWWRFLQIPLLHKPANLLLPINYFDTNFNYITISFDIKISNVTNDNAYVKFNFDFRGTGVNINYSTDTIIQKNDIKNGEWVRVHQTLKTKHDDRYRSLVMHGSIYYPNENAKIEWRNWKLEKGDKPTDWTPAPEDTDEAIETVSAYAQNVANELLTTKGQLTAATTRIDSLQGIIENFVKDDNGMVTVTQTGSGMQIDMTQATNRINQLLTAIESAVTEGEANQLRTELLAAIQAVQSRTAYINATQDAQGRPVITLGATDSPFKVEITNEAINFIQNGQVIAYANGQKFYNLRTVVQQDVQIGIGPGFIWKTRDSGNMGLTWVPAQS